MPKVMISLVLALVTLTLSQSAKAASACDAFKAQKLDRQYANCQKVFRNGDVPNKKALEYTINYMMQNQGQLKDSSCATGPEGESNFNGSIRYNDLCTNCKNKQWIRSGLQNNCSFVINDLKQPWKGGGPYPEGPAPGRTTGYFVDLCGSEPAVKTFYINGGRGKPYADVANERMGSSPSNSSTLAGAFMMEGKVDFNFYSGHPEKYSAISRQFGGGEIYNQKVPAIRLVGLNSSNNTTEYDKPFHVSAFRQGQGCPGVNVSTYPVMQQIAARGKSLYMAYAGPKFEQKGASCVNDSSDYQRRQKSAPRAAERNVASADVPSHRSVFDLPESKKSKIRKLQVDLVQRDGMLFGMTKYQLADGSTGTLQLICFKVEDNEFNCRRGDNGGSFDLTTGPTPRLTIGYLSFDYEEATNEGLVLEAKGSKLLVVEGKTATLSSKDAF